MKENFVRRQAYLVAGRLLARDIGESIREADKLLNEINELRRSLGVAEHALNVEQKRKARLATVNTYLVNRYNRYYGEE